MKLIIHPKLQRFHRWSLGMDKLIHSTIYNGRNFLSMLRLKLTHVSKTSLRNIPASTWEGPICEFNIHIMDLYDQV